MSKLPTVTSTQFTPTQPIKQRKEEPKPEPTPIEKTINALKDLKQKIYGDSMLSKYLYTKRDKKKGTDKYLDDDNKYTWREQYNGNLEESDRKEIVDGIIKAIKLSKEIKPEEDERIKYFITSILKKDKYFSIKFDDFVNSLDIKSSNSDPYTFSKNKRPNILSNIYLYLSNPDMIPTIYTSNMIEGKSIDKIVSDNIIDGRNEVIEERNNKIKSLYKNVDDINNELTDTKKSLDEKANLLEKKEKLLNELNNTVKEQEVEISNLRKFNKDIMPTVNEFNQIKAGVAEILGRTISQDDDIKKLLERNRSKELDERVNKFIGGESIKNSIDSTREKLAAEGFDQNEINQIIAKVLSKEEHYKRVVATNPDLFDRDMSPSTVQNENEQFQSKLRQQNLRYILPKFIERREKLVENTLNPELLKGAFAI